MRNTANYGVHSIRKGIYDYLPEGKFKSVKKPVKGARAEFELGAEQKRTTLTRVGVGGVLFGPAGAIVGGLMKKDKSKCYVSVSFADGDTVLIEGPLKHEKKMRQFAADVNRIAATA